MRSARRLLGTLALGALATACGAGREGGPTRLDAGAAAPVERGPKLAQVDRRSVMASLVSAGRAAPSVNVLPSAPGSTILQFPLEPSGLKKAFPDAKGLVTIVRGNRDQSPADNVTVDVEKMPPNVTFTVFLIEQADKPFGNVQYVADITTRGDGTGESTFSVVSLLAFAVDARDPSAATADPLEGTTTGVNLGHLGMWFSSLDDAKKVLKDDKLQGTIFDGGSPPLHAGPQAMSDGQSEPVL